jgi:multiple sugar transport system ATP-binding protein
MNFLTCQVRRDNDALVFVHPNFTIPVTAAQAATLDAAGHAGTVRMGVRPDALAITLVKPEGPSIEGSIFITELLGGDMLVDVQLSDARVRVKTSTEFAGAPGDACHLTVNREKWHAFSVETGRAYF